MAWLEKQNSGGKSVNVASNEIDFFVRILRALLVLKCFKLKTQFYFFEANALTFKENCDLKLTAVYRFFKFAVS